MRSFCLALLLAGVLPASVHLAAQVPATTRPEIAGIPGPLVWHHKPAQWSIANGQTLSITAGRQTDWFVSPMDGGVRDSSPRLLFQPAADFVLSAKVAVDFRSQWDSGVLLLYVDDKLWAKLCLEMTIEKHPAIVSVVTRDRSDDSNSIAMGPGPAYLKIAKAGEAVFFYASEDGEHWSIIRAFTLGKTGNLRVGFSSQAPVGEQCTSVFSQIRYEARKVNLWSGK
jgi:regulation of enolase protein 1 (concanavalin A-like superfamily)